MSFPQFRTAGHRRIVDTSDYVLKNLTPNFTLAQKRAFARDMRMNPTLAESALWQAIRCSRTGYKFHRQSLVYGYIVDFYCRSLRVAIEVDGSVHLQPEMALRDAKKNHALAEAGVVLLRFENQDVLDFISVVLTRIKSECGACARLKALKASQNQTQNIPSSSSRCFGFLEDSALTQSFATDTAERGSAKAVPSSVNSSDNWTREEVRALNRWFAALSKTKDLNRFVDRRPNAERAWEQRYLFAQREAKKAAESDRLQVGVKRNA